jgi:hypothetical protein
MKRTISVILICCCLIAMPTAALAAGGITVTASSSKAETGDSITVSGTATPDTWISIEGTDADGNILYFSAALSDGAGAYSVTLKAPEMDDGTLTLTAGNGSMTANTSVKIYTPSVSPSTNPSTNTSSSPSTNTSSNKDSNTDTSVTSAQVSQTPQLSETPENTYSAIPSVTPAASGEVSSSAIQTGDAVNSQSPIGILVVILSCVLALLLIVLLIVCVNLFLRKRKKRL